MIILIQLNHQLQQHPQQQVQQQPQLMKLIQVLQHQSMDMDGVLVFGIQQVILIKEHLMLLVKD